MAHEVIWSPEAVEDVESIGAYIQRDSAHYAQAVVGKIVDVAKTLAEFPQIGRMVPELEDPSVHECFVSVID